MRKWLILAGLLSFIGLLGVRAVRVEEMPVSIYFVDRAMLRLIETKETVKATGPQQAAQKILKEIEAGRDNNPKILRLIPKDVKPMQVTVRDGIAYVNLSRELVEEHSGARSHELLTVYAIVNSLTSVDGIVNVRFTVDGKPERDFKGFLDMRETFIPDYYV
ncbi:MAG: hypothetical protein E7397_02910 [Ruminococcaceae bacterium]|nr:hypothetical protein [Oscillospiraceae bacterium]